jgi:hypothetical protein
MRRPKRGRSRESKTDRIASVFISRPLSSISPKEIASELDLDLQLVTSIVSRLRSEGLIDRVGWGQYRLKRDRTISREYLEDINRELRDMASMILGKTTTLDRIETNGDPFKELISIYSSLRKVGGDAMASNLLRLCAKKSLLEEKVDVLMESVGEVVEK